jgi:hypothetical protein
MELFRNSGAPCIYACFLWGGSSGTGYIPKYLRGRPFFQTLSIIVYREMMQTSL